jgi:superfamily I DNA/RNA helicase
VFSRSQQLANDSGQRAIRNANLPVAPLADDGAEGTGVALGTMHRAKGLQFRAVAVIGVDALDLPLARVDERQIDDAARRAFEEQERNLLYVTCTRSRE